MNGPIRLLESSPNPAARALLQAGIGERPPHSALRNTALALGVGGSIVASTTSAVASAGATAVAIPLTTPGLTLVVGKWLVFGTLGGLAFAGTASLVVGRAERNGSVAATATAGTTAGRALPPAAAPAPNVLRPDPGTQALATRDATPPSAAAAPEGKPANAGQSKLELPLASDMAPPSARVPNAQRLSLEIAMLDAARRSLSSGNAHAALAQLDEYAGSPRTGTLDREAQLLRIDALALSGQRAAAVTLAKRYVTAYPNDPHAARLRGLYRAR